MSKPVCLHIVESAAATWTTSENILERDTLGKTLVSCTYPRVLTRIGFVGGAAAFGTILQVDVGRETVARIATTDTTAMNQCEDTWEVSAEVAPNESVVATISAQSGTNKFVAYFEFDNEPMAKIAAVAAAQQAGKAAFYQNRYSR